MGGWGSEVLEAAMPQLHNAAIQPDPGNAQPAGINPRP